MSVLVYGAGGIGLYLAVRLARSGTPVVLKARPDAARRSRDHPVRLIRGGVVDEVDGIEVVDGLDGRRFDAAIIATKAWQVADAAREIGPVLTPGAPVLTTQNGVDAPTHAAEGVPAVQVLAATVVVIVRRVDLLSVELIGSEASLTLGSLHGRSPTPAAERLRETLVRAAIEAEWSPDIRTALWKKLALISSYGGVGAIGDATVGETRAVPRTRALVEQAAREVVAVANRSGARLDEDDLRDVMDVYERRFAAETTASMHRDIRGGRPSELHEQNGAVVAHAARTGVAVPTHETIYAALLPRENAARAGL